MYAVLEREEDLVRDPYRVIVWGPGGLGSVCIWEASQSPAFELIGVRTYSESKEGVDVGELIGCEALGVSATRDVEALLALDCDCVIYTARDQGNFNTDDELLQILTAGKNVVTPLPYQNARFFRDKEFLDRLDAACAAGDSVFHATGVDPDVIDRVLVGMTALCTEIKAIKLMENWDCQDATISPELLAIVGIGRPPEEARRSGIAEAMSTNFLKAIGHSVEHALGVSYARVEEAHDYIVAHEDLQSPYLNIEAGTVGRVTHRFIGFTTSREPFFTMEYNWAFGPEMLPEGVEPQEYWIATIEGRPSLKTVINIKTSLASSERFYQFGKMRSEPGYHSTIAPCLQAIPMICESPPGVMPSVGPRLHWMQDLRQLAEAGERCSA